MRQKFIKHISILILPLFGVLYSCSEDKGIDGPLEHSTAVPGQVSNVIVDNLPGKAKLTYTLPSDKDLLYVVAEYSLENGRKMQVKSSYYNNDVLLEGFTGNNDVEVSLYAVSRSEVKSNPVLVTVSPLKAPIFDIYDNISVGPDFGGLRIIADNPTAEDISILVMQRDVQGDWEILPTSIYTSASEVNQAIRGLEVKEQEFAIAIRDRWQNVTDTLFTTVSPYFEQLMPKSNYAAIHLDNDTPVIGTYPVSNLWDNQYFYWWGSYFTERTYTQPLESDGVGGHIVTWDIGQITKLSRLRIWAFSEPIGGKQLYYYLGAMKRFEIWGSAVTPQQNGALDNGDWVKLGSYEVIKPSGLPYAQENNDDLVAAKDGEDWEIPITAPAVRYLRIRCLEDWNGGEYMAVSEVHVYGNPNF